jgi:hypothetical protein
MPGPVLRNGSEAGIQVAVWCALYNKSSNRGLGGRFAQKNKRTIMTMD